MAEPKNRMLFQPMTKHLFGVYGQGKNGVPKW